MADLVLSPSQYLIDQLEPRMNLMEKNGLSTASYIIDPLTIFISPWNCGLPLKAGDVPKFISATSKIFKGLLPPIFEALKKPNEPVEVAEPLTLPEAVMCVAVPNRLSTVICLVVDPSIIGKTAVADVISEWEAEGSWDILTVVWAIGIGILYYLYNKYS